MKLEALLHPARLATTAVLLALPAAAQGDNGFLRGEGRLDIATSCSVERYGRYRLENPSQSFDDVERRIFGLYAAYGLCTDLDLVAHAARVAAESESGSGFADESGLQDASLQLKWRGYERALGSGTFSWLFAPGIRFPLTDYPSFADNPLNGLGEGDTVLLGRVIAHYQWSSSYAALETGYDHRNGTLDDEVPVNLSLGTTLDRTTLQLFYSNVLALGDTVSNERFSDEHDGYLRVGLGAYVRISEAFGLFVNVRYSDEGENDSTGASVGTVFRL